MDSLHLSIHVGCSNHVPSSWHQKGQLQGTQDLESAGDEKTLGEGKVWNPPETKNGLRAARFDMGADPTSGSMFLTRFSTNVHRKIDLTNAFKSFFRDDSFKPCSKIAGLPGKQCLGCLGERARGLRDAMLETCRRP